MGEIHEVHNRHGANLRGIQLDGRPVMKAPPWLIEVDAEDHAVGFQVSPDDVMAAAARMPLQHTGASPGYAAWNPNPGAQEQVGDTSTDVDELYSNTSAQIRALDAAISACPGISAADRTAWTGYKQGWTTGSGSWAQVKSSTTPRLPFTYLTELLAVDKTYNAMLAVSQQVPTWWAKLQTAGCNATPPPGIPTSGQCGWFDSMLGRCSAPTASPEWASAFKWVAILGIVGLAAWYLGPLVSAAAGAFAHDTGSRSRELTRWRTA